MIVDLGGLKTLLEETALAGELKEGTGVELVPLFETGQAIGGLEESPNVRYVSAWEIRFTSGKGSFAYRAASIAEAVDAARTAAESWR